MKARPQPEEKADCDCCEADCGCEDCERCSEEGIQVGKDWVPPAKGKPRKGAG